jgi:hypothetical protein
MLLEFTSNQPQVQENFVEASPVVAPGQRGEVILCDSRTAAAQESGRRQEVTAPGVVSQAVGRRNLRGLASRTSPQANAVIHAAINMENSRLLSCNFAAQTGGKAIPSQRDFGQTW